MVVDGFDEIGDTAGRVDGQSGDPMKIARMKMGTPLHVKAKRSTPFHRSTRAVSSMLVFARVGCATQLCLITGFGLLWRMDKSMVARLVALGIGVLRVLAVTLGCFYVVEPGERGVHVTLGTMSDQFVAPGFGMKLPVITQIWRVNVQQDTREVGAECFSSDLQQISSPTTSSLLYVSPSSRLIGSNIIQQERI